MKNNAVPCDTGKMAVLTADMAKDDGMFGFIMDVLVQPHQGRYRKINGLDSETGLFYHAEIMIQIFLFQCNDRCPVEIAIRIPDTIKGKVKDYPSDHDMYRAVYQIITPYIEGLIDEFHKIIGYLRSEEHNAFFEGIYIYGQGAMIQSLDAYIEKQMNIPTKRSDPLQKLAMPEDSMMDDMTGGMSYALSLGLAMRRVPWL